MKRPIRYLNRQSLQGKIIAECDQFFSKIERIKRGNKCEVHNRPCSRLGVSHILSKARHPRLRYFAPNILIAGWFCSHYWSHQESDHPRAQEYQEAVVRILGENWKDKLLIAERMQPKHSSHYMSCLRHALKKELKELEA